MGCRSGTISGKWVRMRAQGLDHHQYRRLHAADLERPVSLTTHRVGKPSDRSISMPLGCRSRWPFMCGRMRCWRCYLVSMSRSTSRSRRSPFIPAGTDKDLRLRLRGWRLAPLTNARPPRGTEYLSIRRRVAGEIESGLIKVEESGFDHLEFIRTRFATRLRCNDGWYRACPPRSTHKCRAARRFPRRSPALSCARALALSSPPTPNAATGQDEQVAEAITVADQH